MTQTKAMDLLHRIMEIMMKDNRKSEADALQAMIQWLGFKLKVDQGIISGSIHWNAYQKLEALDLSPLSAQQEDVLGYFVTKHYGQHCTSDFFVDKALCDRLAADIEIQDQKVFHRILDRCAGSGGLLIALSQRFGNKAILYAAEPDLMAYRIANINRKLFNINARILHADYRIHDLSEGSRNWMSANLWNPPKWDNLVKLEAAV